MPHPSLLSCSLKLSRKVSIESFISPTAFALENSAKDGEGPRNSSPMNRIIAPRRSRFPQIPQILARRTAVINVHRQKTLIMKSKWTRLCVRLTKRTISLHENDLQSDTLDLILLENIKRVKRVDDRPCCLQVETDKDKVYLFAFDGEEELYDWLTDISPIDKPTDVTHDLHVEADKEDQSRLVGLPQDWEFFNPSYSRTSITQEMIEAALPKIPLSEHQSMFDLDYRSHTPDSIFIHDESDEESYDDATILIAQRAIQTETRHLINLHSRLPYKINTDSEQIKLSNWRNPTEGSPSTPFLTPDTAGSVSTPLAPFRESPYRYRETDAQDLTGQVHKLTEYAEEFGGFADIWRATWKTTSGQSIPVAVKVLRVYDQRLTDKIEKRLYKEVRVWHQLRHKNVVQMYGICEGFGRLPAMVSPWYTKGNVKKYLRGLGDGATVARRLKLLKEVACGLNYLHTFTLPLSLTTTTEGHIVHGDLKGANILVNDLGEAALADFGLSSIRAEVNNSTSSTFTGGTIRFMAPELLFEPKGNKVLKTCASDTYSYGSVILEILTDKLPYHELSNDAQVIMEVKNKCTPKRPTKPSVDPGVWDLMERCWSEEPSDRPNMAFVLSRMEKFYKEHRKSMLPEEDAA